MTIYALAGDNGAPAFTYFQASMTMPAFAEGHQVGPYRIVRLIGEGGMGAVYEARQETLDRRVALKTLHSELASNKEAMARFFNEAKVLSRMEHPSIVQVSDFGTTPEGSAYLVMEFLRGESLSRRLSNLAERGDRLPVTAALQIAFQVADAIAVAHAQGIVHRDLKPDNLMLVADPIAPSGERVKILDFGIVKLTKSEERGTVKTNTQAIMGTPMYMSPEQCAGAGGVDARTDVYSLGCVLYEMLAGRAPFLGDGPGELIGKHLFQEPPSLASLGSKVPAPVAALVHRMLAKDKKQRLSMSAAADELGRRLSKMPGSGQVVRSLPPANTDPDATRTAGIPALSTTLGHLTGQSARAPHKNLRKIMLGGVAVVALGATALLVRPRSPAPRLRAAAPQAVPARTAANASVRWHIETSPANAAVLDAGGVMLGVTPWTQNAVAVSEKRSLRLHLDGYADLVVSLDGNADFDAKFPLTRLEAPQTAPTAKSPAQPSRPTTAKPAAARPASSPSTPKPPGTHAPAQSKRSKIGYEE